MYNDSTQISLIIGISKFGITTWALNNRYLGWFVLLAYLLTGSLAGRIFGQTHRVAVLNTLMITGLIVTATEWGLLLLKSGGILKAGTGWIGYNVEGFVQNRNAFAFQMLIVLSVIFATLENIKHNLDFWMIAIVITGIVVAWSRAGLIALAVITAIAWRGRYLNRNKSLKVVGIVLIMVLIPYVSAKVSTGSAFQVQLASASSDSEHWRTIFAGLRMWSENPILGAGLGAFFREWQIIHGAPLVIHSIYVWMLAETGIVGFGCFLLFVYSVLRLKLSKPSDGGGLANFENKAVLLILACMMVVGLFHDMLYQRIFWFSMGIFLMRPEPQIETKQYWRSKRTSG